MRADVSALYIDPTGPYPSLVADCWDEARDARLYDGPLPVVAHPPCQLWVNFAALNYSRYGGGHNRPGNDGGAFASALASVRRWGGVLEHPIDSSLFRHCGLPRPGELPDAWGGRTFAVRQVAWGHPCVKPTWLYVVGVPAGVVEAGIRTAGAPTKRVTNGPRGPQLPRASAAECRHSPPDFARWLIELAAGARP